MVAEFTLRSANSQDDTESIFDLMDGIYKSTEMMCEEFSEKYPSLVDLKAELEEYIKLAGALFLIAEENTKLSGYIGVKPLRQSKLAHTAHLNI